MHTLGDLRFVRVAQLDGTSLGLDRRWFGRHGLLVVLLVALATPCGVLSQDSTLPAWLKVCFSLAAVLGVSMTSLAHELGHAVAGRLAGLQVRAIILGPHGGTTIRASSADPLVNVCTALSGPLANVVAGSLCLAAAAQTSSLLGPALVQLATIQFITAAVNVLPFGKLDGARILSALLASRAELRLSPTPVAVLSSPDAP